MDRIIKVMEGYWRTGEHGRAYIKECGKNEYRIYLANGEYKGLCKTFEEACKQAITL